MTITWSKIGSQSNLADNLTPSLGETIREVVMTEENADSGQRSSDNRDHDFYLERYKYILQQMAFLSHGYHRSLMLFQVLASAIVGAWATLLFTWEELGIDAETARLGIRALNYLFVILGIFVILLTVAGIFSWFDYRKEETKLLNRVTSDPGFRKPPSWKGFLRWYETWVIVLMLALIALGLYFIEGHVIPLITEVP